MGCALTAGLVTPANGRRSRDDVFWCVCGVHHRVALQESEVERAALKERNTRMMAELAANGS